MKRETVKREKGPRNTLTGGAGLTKPLLCPGVHPPVRSRRLLRRQGERLLFDDFADDSAADALCTNPHFLVFTARQLDFHALQIRLEFTPCDASNLGTNATQVLCLTAGLYLVSD